MIIGHEELQEFDKLENVHYISPNIVIYFRHAFSGIMSLKVSVFLFINPNTPIITGFVVVCNIHIFTTFIPGSLDFGFNCVYFYIFIHAQLIGKCCLTLSYIK